MNRQIQLSYLSIFIAAALIGSVISLAGDQSTAFATKKKLNEAFQGQSQESLIGESAECFSNNNTIISCNNVALSFNLNDGNNAAAQR